MIPNTEDIVNQTNETPIFLVVGLGNIGRPYENTRHNVGFAALDRFAADCGASVTRMQFHALCNDNVRVGGARVILMKPTTLMNLSGVAVAEAMSFFHLPPERLIVLCDDVSFDVGMLRIRMKGSHGGHNGLRNITDRIGTQGFCRIKIGVGQKPHPDYDLADWVLGKLPREDLHRLEEVYVSVSSAISLLIAGRTDEAMRLYSK